MLGLGAQAQDTINFGLIGQLPVDIQESSGLEFLGGQLWTHEDGGGGSMLHQLDTLNGNVLRSVFVEQATNVDWEDICADDDYVYVGDFGNNAGARTDLKIYRIGRDSLLLSSRDTVLAEVIEFSYPDQSDFTPTQFSTRFDCEAMVVDNGVLHLFTKRWNDEWTKEYELSVNPGLQVAVPKDSIFLGAFVTGADFEPGGYLYLSTYSTAVTSNPSLVRMQIGNSSMLSSSWESYPVGVANAQLESVCLSGADRGFISSEDNFFASQRLWDFQYEVLTSVGDNPGISLISPVLELGILTVRSPREGQFSYRIYDMQGRLVEGQSNQNLNEAIQLKAPLEGSIYLICVETQNSARFNWLVAANR